MNLKRKLYNFLYKIKKIDASKIKRFFVGMKYTDGFIYKFFIYTLLVGIGFVYLFPILYMLSYSLKDVPDLLNPMVDWIPSHFYIANYIKAYEVLDYFNTLIISLKVTLIPAVFQTITAALVGYGFAKFRFPLKKTLFVLVLITFIIPPQVTMIPKYVLFNQYKLLGTSWSIILPAIFGQGINAAIFVLIFYQFYRMIPKSLDEAAEIDGANKYYIFLKISIPLVIPAFITSFLFSFVWYWNETYISGLFLENNLPTLQFKLYNFVGLYEQSKNNQIISMAIDSVKMAGIIYIIVPVLIVYFILQRWFIEGIDKSGITGE